MQKGTRNLGKQKVQKKKKGRRQRTQEKKRTLIGINQENIIIGRKRIISPINKLDFTSTQLCKSISLFVSEPCRTQFLK